MSASCLAHAAPAVLALCLLPLEIFTVLVILDVALALLLEVVFLLLALAFARIFVPNCALRSHLSVEPLHLARIFLNDGRARLPPRRSCECRSNSALSKATASGTVDSRCTSSVSFSET